MKHLKIGVRLAGGFGLLVALVVLMSVVGLLSLSAIDRSVAEMTQQSLAKERLIGDWYRNINTGSRRTTAIAKSTDPGLADFFAEEAAESSRQSSALQKQIEPLIRTPEELSLWEGIKEARAGYLSARDDVSKARREGRSADAERLFAQNYQPVTQRYLDLVLSLSNLQRAGIDAEAQAIHAEYTSVRLWIILLGAAAVVLGLGVAWWLTRGITRPLADAVRVARTVAANDLTSVIHADSRDEVGQLLQALHEMNGNLARVVGHVRVNADSIATASGQIDAGNQDLSSRTEEQASALEETSASIQELASAVRQNADHARQANQLAVEASSVATQGGQAMGDVEQTMKDIDESSRKISDIIGVIDSIAFQTNILALNAAVEAARAGEQGRGFAVVAAEVRALAQRSAGAAKDIKELISNSVAKVGEGSQQVEVAGRTMEAIVDSIRRVTDIMGEITAASDEQRTGIDQVSQAVEQMDQVTQQNAALVEESAAATGALKDQAAQLAEAVSVFRIASERTATLVPQLPVRSAPAMRTVSVPVRKPAATSVPRSAQPAPRLASPTTTERPATKPAAPSDEDWSTF
ncbi:methyl-accepting chemotaxis protein [Corticimicrobacter populi]|uniref:Methyl-accepting chemotaxis protein n=1 Tax=Corticimicrobacter populi TaxID=2175229 RepID=A0A2V1K2A3_9BURK|nr:methyl-accepting chemotaxis protein [Corticimicrobacter populi]PWF24680.1 hypothetical protein DD235_00315 [Corticimicrobacter populi]